MLTIFLGRELEVNLCGSEASIAPAIGVAAKWWWSPGQGHTSGGQPSRGFRDRPQRDWILFREIDAATGEGDEFLLSFLFSLGLLVFGNGNVPPSAVLHLPGASKVGRADTYCAMTLMLIRPPGAAPCRRSGVPGASRLHAGPQTPHQLPPQVLFSFLFKFFKLFLSFLPPPIGGESAVVEEEQKSTCCSSKSHRWSILLGCLLYTSDAADE